MNKQSNAYIITYATVLVIVVAFVLSFVSLKLKPLQQRNMEIEKKSDILKSVGLFTVPEGDYNAGVETEYSKYITKSLLVNTSGNVVSEDASATFNALVNLKKAFATDASTRELPIFISTSNSGETRYIFPVEGVGLWGPIWGFVALTDDFNTISGVVFAHTSETPGLGAEIATPIFEDKFINKKLFNGDDYKGISVLKGEGASSGNDNAVDAISGGTITSVAVEEMLTECLGNSYRAFIERMKREKETELQIENTNQIPVDSTKVEKVIFDQKL